MARRRLNASVRPSSNRAERMIQAEQTDDASIDGALIAQWMAGDERAATAIVERHAGALARFAVRLGVDEDVDELVQDTFIKAFSALESFRAEAHPSIPWIS